MNDIAKYLVLDNKYKRKNSVIFVLLNQDIVKMKLIRQNESVYK